ncbi:fasciclin-like arabinogalactan protein 4 [Pyrus ussuriensis x Pyrus communis]|uniref:Fasciclin-like arabinogalactan protein 4 n=1 Tax=Pyrus ussuriensis x Pyrus communis TaxID=2448454 RepID=A0A5N5FUR5_9ROSA|nr:fasciclin-like arabinogalactan protein 4 [Pyrus ussuriensis x Pyrus communis]
MASDARPPLGMNITKVLIDGHNFNVAASMLAASGVVEEFEAAEGGAGITLFVPTDTAFSNLPSTVRLQSLPADRKAVVLKFHVIPSYYPLGSLESIVNPVQPTLATDDGGATSYTLNISRINGSMAISTGIVQAVVTQTVFDQKPVSIFGVSEVLLPKEIFGRNPIFATQPGPPLDGAPPPYIALSPESLNEPPSHLSSPPGFREGIRSDAATSAINGFRSLWIASCCIGLYLMRAGGEWGQCTARSSETIRSEGGNLQCDVLRRFFRALFLGYASDGDVNGTSQCPPAFLKDADSNLIDMVNPDFDTWIQQDATVMSWINSSVHPTVFAALIGKISSHSAWTTLCERYASQSIGRLLQLRTDTLSLSGAPISDSDIVAIILNNVGLAYESTVASAQARDETITYSTLEALLLGTERQQKMHSAFTADAGPTAFTVVYNGGRPPAVFQGRGSSSRFRGHGSPNGGYGSSSRPCNLLGSHHGPHQGSHSRQPDGIFRNALSLGPFPTDRIQCQICSRYGHLAIDCFNRLNMSYEGRVPMPKLQAYAAGVPPLFNSGANAHITNDPAQVSNLRHYHGTDQVNDVVGGTRPSHGEDAFQGPSRDGFYHFFQ